MMNRSSFISVHRYTVFLVTLFALLLSSSAFAQYSNNAAFAKINFNDTILEWDGFGLNYVEACQTLDPFNEPQDLGGFSFLTEEQKDEINQLVFGPDGLRPSVWKMFLDPFHQLEEGGAFDHEATTKNMRYMTSEGLRIAKENGYSFDIVTTLYGPPPFMTIHNDPANSMLDPEYRQDLALYMIDWIKYLQKNGYPVKYLSLHNEGTDWLRWPMYENHRNEVMLGRDYNMLWRAEDVANYMAFLRPVMDEHGLQEIGITPGEPINLFRFDHFGIADAIASNPDAVDALGLVTSHGFGLGNLFGRGYANTNNEGARMLAELIPGLKTWITSMSWGKLDTRFCVEVYEHIYSNKANAVIPWAFIQKPAQWYEHSAHDQAPIIIDEDNAFRLTKGYHLFKQFSSAGRAGMQVVNTSINRPEVFIAAFAQAETNNPDAFVVINYGEHNVYTSDIVELSFDVNGSNLYYLFPYKDPVQAWTKHNKGQMDGVQFKARPTDDGYVMEASFPWETLGAAEGELPAAFTFNAAARDGRDMPHGQIGWTGEDNSFTGEIITGANASNDGKTVTIAALTGGLTIDGFVESSWAAAEKITFDSNYREGIDPRISGEWQLLYDDENLFVLVTMKDPTNEMGRPIEISVEGSNYTTFKAFRTDELDENYHSLGEFTVENGILKYLSPNHSTTTFIGVK